MSSSRPAPAWRSPATGCPAARSSARSTSSAAGRIIKPKIDGDLLIYNWAQYMDPDLKKGFSEKYGVKVNEVNFDNLEAMVDQAPLAARSTT